MGGLLLGMAGIELTGAEGKVANLFCTVWIWGFSPA
jgi:hypothetical protein